MRTLLRKGSSKFQYTFKLGGVQYRGTTGETNKQLADAAMYREREKVLRQIKAGGPVHGTRARDLTAALLCRLDQERAKNTSNNELYRTKRIADFWGKLGGFFTDFTSIMRPDLNAYIEWRRGPNPDKPLALNQTIKQELFALKRGLEMATDEGFSVHIPVRWPELKRSPNSGRGAGFVPTDDEMVRFFGCLMRNRKAYIVATFMLMTNFRREEVWRVAECSLRPVVGPPIEGIAMMMVVPEGVRKNGRPVCLPLTPTGVLAFELLYRGVYDVKTPFATASRHAGLTRCVIPRCLRKAYASAGAPCGDPYALDLAMDHAMGVKGRYQEAFDPRMANVALTVARRYSRIL